MKVLCLLILSLVFACKTNSTNSDIKNEVTATTQNPPKAPGDFRDSLNCPSGWEKNYFSLTKPTAGITIPSEVPVLRPINETSVLVRIDVCTQDEAAELERIVVALDDHRFAVFAIDDTIQTPEYFDFEVGGDATANGYRIPRSSVKLQGLEKALYGDTSTLSLSIPIKDIRINLQGWGESGAGMWIVGQSFYAIAVAANLEYGDSFVSLIDGCIPGWGKSQHKITAKNLEIELDTCGGVPAKEENSPKPTNEKKVGDNGRIKPARDLDGGGNLRYYIQKISVQDSNPKLSSEYKGKKITLEGDALKAVLYQEVRHHNFSDCFALTLPQAQYIGDLRRGDSNTCKVEDVIDVPELADEASEAPYYLRIKYGKTWSVQTYSWSKVAPWENWFFE